MDAPRGILARLARWAVRHRRLVVVGWIVLLVAVGALGRTAGGDYANDMSVPGTESQKAFDTLRSRFPERAGDTMQVVVHSPGGVRSPEVEQAVEASRDRISKVPGVVFTTSPYEPPVPAVSEDGTTAIVNVQFEQRAKDIPRSSVDAVQEAAAPIGDSGAQVEFGGAPLETHTGPSGSEVIGLAAAMVVLLLAFGSLLAMAVPLVVALFALGLGLSLVGLLAALTSIGTVGPVVAAMIGLGVGIDYALLIVTRHREGLASGMAPEDSIPLAMATAGRSVLVAGSTVIVAILSLYLIGIRFVASIGLAATITVATTLVASITLLPAFLGFAGSNLDRWRINLLHHHGVEEAESWWHRWAIWVQHHRWSTFLASLLVLGVLAIPLFSMRMGTADAGSNPTSSTTRRAYDLVSDGFGPGFNGPLLVTVEDPGGLTSGPGKARLDALIGRLRTSTPGVEAVAPPTLNDAGDTATVPVIPETSPQDRRTEALVHRIRDVVVPETVGDAPTEVHVGGPTAVAIDLADRMAERLPVFMGMILLLSFVLLAVEFRSLFVPFKAALMNLVSIGAAYGAVVAVFQWGWLGSLLGVEPGPVESFAPMMLFAVLFGLSMDYEVFLLSRVREEYLATGDNNRAVAEGIAATARVITAAASVMVVVFASFLLNDQRVVKMFGFGLAFAILVDATLVRLVLVPATMDLAGKANWWMPRWLDRLLPSLGDHDGGDGRRAARDPQAPPDGLPEPGRSHEPDGRPVPVAGETGTLVPSDGPGGVIASPEP